MIVCRKRGASEQEKIQYIKYLHCQLERFAIRENFSSNFPDFSLGAPEQIQETQEPRKGGVFAKGSSARSNVMPKEETKNTQGYWAQQCIWHSERHSQERCTFLQKPPSKNPLFLVPEKQPQPSRVFWTRVWRIPEIFSFFLQFWGFDSTVFFFFFKICAKPPKGPFRTKTTIALEP